MAQPCYYTSHMAVQPHTPQDPVAPLGLQITQKFGNLRDKPELMPALRVTAEAL